MLIRRSAQITGGLFIAVGLLALFTGDMLLGGVWVLLGTSMWLSNPFGEERVTFRSARGIAATAALIGALALLVIDFV